MEILSIIIKRDITKEKKRRKMLMRRLNSLKNGRFICSTTIEKKKKVELQRYKYFRDRSTSDINCSKKAAK